jgi:hypothetical protein
VARRLCARARDRARAASTRAAVTRGLARAASVLLIAALVAGAACKRKPSAPAGDAPCLSNAACASDQYCGFSPGLCGRGPTPGVCRPRPTTGPQARAPVCGCDGNVYENEAEAHRAGVDLAVMGGCKSVLADWAPCGPRFCDVRASYCEIYLSDVFEIPTTYTCRPLPAACRAVDGGPALTCACFPAGTPCLAFCGPLPTGGLTGFHLTCQGVQDPEHRRRPKAQQ